MSIPLPPTTLIFAPKGRRPLALPIVRGQVVIVSDASGILPNDWQLSLLENSSAGTARVIQEGAVLSQDLLHLVGFNLPLPDLPVREYLATFCTDTDGILREFELSEVASLSCAYLPPAPSRQITLLHALSQERGIIILNDPFLPFNGRWRESFAAFIAEQASLGGAAVVCCNVGFMPKTWTTLPSVKIQDVAGLLPLPAEMRASSSHQAQEHSQKQPPEATSPTTPRQTNEANAAYYLPIIPLPIPASAIKVYKEVKDWIFEPLATASRFLRTWSGIVAAVGLSVVLGTMGVLLIPNLPEARALLLRVSEKFTYKWNDVTQFSQTESPEQPSREAKTAKATSSPPESSPALQGVAGESSEEASYHGLVEVPTVEHALDSPFVSKCGVPLRTELPHFSLYVLGPVEDEENTELLTRALQAALGDDSTLGAPLLFPFGGQISSVLSHSFVPFYPSIGWSRNLQNLQNAESINDLPVKKSESETEITSEGDTNPLAIQE